MSAEMFQRVYDFNGPMAPAVAASVVDGPWSSKKTGSGGTIVVASGGLMQLAMDATSEVQNLCLYQGDILPFPIDKLVSLEILASVSASLAAAVSVGFGLASARNDAFASISTRALFKITGNNNLLAETADGTNTQANAATGLTLGTTVRKFLMEFKSGITTVSGGLSTGGKSNVIFSAENSNGQMVRVADSKIFNMSASTGNLQLFGQIQKTSGTATGTLSFRRFRPTWRE